LKNSKFPIQLDIYGNKVDTNYFDECFNNAKNNNVDIDWKGQVESTKIVNILKNYDALILPSYTEMSPLVIQEAFLAGIPVIASNVNGNAKQLIDGENGLLFDCGSSRSLQATIESFYSDNYKSKWKLKYTPNTFQNVAKEVENIYMKAIYS
jgi:glycosyltransferase involved in cell wall biosynthesis